MSKNRDRSRRNRGRGDAAHFNNPHENKRVLPDVFDIPGSALGGITHIEMAENREAVVDGCQGVLEYDDSVIKLATGKMVVKFIGRGLQINVLTRDSAVVTGFITSVEFIV